MNSRRIALALMLVASLSAGAIAEPLDRSEVNPVDRGLMFPYSGTLDFASDMTQYAAFLAPAAFLAVAPVSGYLGVGLMYAGSTALAFGSSTVLKGAVSRSRPYMYFDGAPEEEVAEGKGSESFPSRHSALAFSGAAFTATLFALRYPNSKFRIPVTVAAYTLACTTAGLRIGSGSHFTSDVLVGVLIGSLSGFVVPYVADKMGWLGSDPLTGGTPKDGARIAVTPMSVSCIYTY